MDDLKQDSTLYHGDYEQVKWERDCAIQQLREDYGVGLGQRKPRNFFAVVFCKDCKYSNRDMGLPYCEKLRLYQKDFDFCSYGRRRESNEEVDSKR